MPKDRRPFFDAKRGAQLLATVLAAGAAWGLLFATLGESESVSVSSFGDEERTTTMYRLPDLVGPGPALAIAAIPLLLTLIPLLARAYRQALSLVCTVVLGALTVLTGFTVGTFAVPALAAAVIACIVPGRASRISSTESAPPVGTGITGAG